MGEGYYSAPMEDFNQINTNNQLNNTGSSGVSITNASIISGTVWVILGGILIYFFQDRTYSEVFTEGHSIGLQLLWGIVSGVLFGLAGAAMFKIPHLKRILDDYFIIKQLREFSLSNGQIIQISLVAGITEEILFRAAIQPLIGIWLTSIIFIAVHGYVRLRTFSHAFFTLFTFILSMMLGYLYIYSGLIAAMAAHAVYDILVLWVVSRKK